MSTIETKEFTLSPTVLRDQALTGFLVRVRFPPDDLDVFTAPSPMGIAASHYLQSIDADRHRFAFGGIYFQERSQRGMRRRRPDGFVFYKPPAQAGKIVSPRAPFAEGGFLLVDAAGWGVLVRQQRLDIREQGGTTALCIRPEKRDERCGDIQSYRLVVQSKPILVYEGREDGNNNVASARRAALGFHRSGEMVFVATGTELTLKEFGDLLAAWDITMAINLDGHTSVQLAERQADGSIRDWFSHPPEPMPLLFGVRD